ncbi:hypothetical protein CPT_Muenster_447 [Klebsiella phage Muenster]|nr:hypothetical protein CPT_Muenster_447 [Klebsiella phage Muenster]
MSLELKLKKLLLKYVQELPRLHRREFNSGLKKYPYIMFYPELEEKPDGKVHALLQIGFSKSTYKIKKGDTHEAFTFLETGNYNNDNIFYIDSPLAYIFDEALYISTADIEEVHISKAPVELAINANVLRKADTYAFFYALTDFFSIQSIPYGMSEDIEKSISDIPELNIEVIFEDIRIFDNSKRKHGKITERVKFNNECIGFFSLSGLDILSVKTVVLDEKKWSEMMNFVREKVNLESLLDKPYTVLEPDVDCDVYFSVPGVTGFYYDQSKLSKDLK